MSLYGAVGPVDVGEVKVASHPEYRVFVSGCEVFDGIAHVVVVVVVVYFQQQHTKK